MLLQKCVCGTISGDVGNKYYPRKGKQQYNFLETISGHFGVGEGGVGRVGGGGHLYNCIVV